MKHRIITALLGVVLTFTSVDISAFAMDKNEEICTEQAVSPAVTNQLTGTNLAVYKKLKELVTQTANGELTSTEYYIPVVDLGLEQYQWTAEELGMESIRDKDGFLKDEAFDLAYEKIAYDSSLVLDLLLKDCPYELYWFDYTAGFRTSQCRMGAGKDTIYIETGMSFHLPVSKDYAIGTYEYDVSKLPRVQTAVKNAKAIVEKYKNSSDYDKLLGYRNEICNLVSYDWDAAVNLDGGDDAYQLISVFDGEEDTKVVCEGYSKAFQYLCDLTTFEDCRINCISADGYLISDSIGPHMWNIVTMEDGKRYLVDITCCDEDGIGADTLLFMAEYSGIGENKGYTFDTRAKDAEYVYDDSIKELYGASELEISPTPYVKGKRAAKQLIKYKANAATCTKKGNIEYYVCTGCNKVYTDANETNEILLGDTILPKSDHTSVTDPKVFPTCEDAGKTEGSHCSVCKKVIVKQEEIPATGHNLVWKTDREPTETLHGLKHQECTKCGHKENENTPIDKLPPHIHDMIYKGDVKTLVHWMEDGLIITVSDV